MTSDCDVRPPLQFSGLAEGGRFHVATILVLVAFGEPRFWQANELCLA